MKKIDLALFILFLMLFISCNDDNHEEVQVTLTENIEVYEADYILSLIHI